MTSHCLYVKLFSGAEANYDTHNKELLAIIKALEEWCIFLKATDEPIQEPEIILPPEIFANMGTSEEELAVTEEIQVTLREDPSLEPIVWFLTEDADNAPLKTVVPASETLKEHLLREFHDSPLVGHLGQQRTLELLSHNYWWPGMKSSAKEWLECCPTCQANQKAYSGTISLKPLEVPPYLFHTISYNFITGFPKSQGFNAILVVIDSFSKMGHFIPTPKKVTVKGLAEIFVNNIWKVHRLPIKTVSDIGMTFTGKFLKALYKWLGSKPRFSSAYHPKSDGQTKQVNQFIEFYLRSYVMADHSNWAKWLPLSEFAYNNSKHSATEKTPFKLVFGRTPAMNPSNIPVSIPEADNIANCLLQEQKEAKAALGLSKEKMAGNKGTILGYSIGKKVWLDRKNI
ncbi:Retrotransposable element Tf2 protein [Rhizoctonia solani]|uniref:Retrotransposable element Tf2 protein n=1 Tax=Rhizoctonia solani TaxID=456999 RepID=A0A8H8P5S6_9AGAM|nr:Retrotransposable element Tf2 protein [Rhizoctonia solani]QRW24092.1 Retrotransposable element Tf2 protein [Rhizoctonia solani]